MAARLRPFSLLRCKEIETHMFVGRAKRHKVPDGPRSIVSFTHARSQTEQVFPQFRIPPIPACSATNMPPEPGRSPSTEASSDAEHDQVLGETATTALTAEGAAEIFKMKRDHVRRDTMSAKVCADHARLAARCVCHACVHFRLRANNASACLASC